ncbi:MAG: hypothetical protein H6739_11940 [Alphaproteobacteria bacterium]|nr:hypothetical protein [Alphaproteobacteria bacterium]
MDLFEELFRNDDIDFRRYCTKLEPHYSSLGRIPGSHANCTTLIQDAADKLQSVEDAAPLFDTLLKDYSGRTVFIEEKRRAWARCPAPRKSDASSPPTPTPQPDRRRWGVGALAALLALPIAFATWSRCGPGPLPAGPPTIIRSAFLLDTDGLRVLVGRENRAGQDCILWKEGGESSCRSLSWELNKETELTEDGRYAWWLEGRETLHLVDLKQPSPEPTTASLPPQEGVLASRLTVTPDETLQLVRVLEDGIWWKHLGGDDQTRTAPWRCAGTACDAAISGDGRWVAVVRRRGDDGPVLGWLCRVAGGCVTLPAQGWGPWENAAVEAIRYDVPQPGGREAEDPEDSDLLVMVRADTPRGIRRMVFLLENQDEQAVREAHPLHNDLNDDTTVLLATANRLRYKETFDRCFLAFQSESLRVVDGCNRSNLEILKLDHALHPRAPGFTLAPHEATVAISEVSGGRLEARVWQIEGDQLWTKTIDL